MEVEDYLKEELKRLNRINGLLETQTNKNGALNISIIETIKNNTLAMCEIAKVYHSF